MQHLRKIQYKMAEIYQISVRLSSAAGACQTVADTNFFDPSAQLGLTLIVLQAGAELDQKS